MSKKISAITLLFVILLIIPAKFIAQINPPNNCTFPGGCCPDGLPPTFCPGCPPCTPVPLNGELIFLLIAGLSIGFYFFMEKKKLIGQA